MVIVVRYNDLEGVGNLWVCVSVDRTGIGL